MKNFENVAVYAQIDWSNNAPYIHKFCHFPLTVTVVLTTLSHYRVSVWSYFSLCVIFSHQIWLQSVKNARDTQVYTETPWDVEKTQ